MPRCEVPNTSNPAVGLNRLTNNILEHTAHHVDPRVPLYNLPEVQGQLEATYSEEIIVERLTPGYVLESSAHADSTTTSDGNGSIMTGRRAAQPCDRDRHGCGVILLPPLVRHKINRRPDKKKRRKTQIDQVRSVTAAWSLRATSHRKRKRPEDGGSGYWPRSWRCWDLRPR